MCSRPFYLKLKQVPGVFCPFSKLNTYSFHVSMLMWLFLCPISAFNTAIKLGKRWLNGFETFTVLLLCCLWFWIIWTFLLSRLALGVMCLGFCNLGQLYLCWVIIDYYWGLLGSGFALCFPCVFSLFSCVPMLLLTHPPCIIALPSVCLISHVLFKLWFSVQFLSSLFRFVKVAPCFQFLSVFRFASA